MAKSIRSKVKKKNRAEQRRLVGDPNRKRLQARSVSTLRKSLRFKSGDGIDKLKSMLATEEVHNPPVPETARHAFVFRHPNAPPPPPEEKDDDPVLLVAQAAAVAMADVDDDGGSDGGDDETGEGVWAVDGDPSACEEGSAGDATMDVAAPELSDARRARDAKRQKRQRRKKFVQFVTVAEGVKGL
ncbi:unnamed protein product [Phaeothamnion confervicola]